MSPELSVLAVVGAVLAFAYVVVYPRMADKTITRMMQIDLLLSALLLLAVGYVYLGSGTQFSLVLFSVPWWAYTLLCAALIEVPLFLWFCKRYDIDLSPPGD